MRYIFILLTLLIIILLCFFLWYQNNAIDVSNYEYEYGLEKKIRIVQLSDFHSKTNSRILKETAQLKPDIIFVTGDYINDKFKNFDKMCEFAKELSKLSKVVYIPGNHEKRLENFQDLLHGLNDSGFIVLNNDYYETELNNSTLSILGLVEEIASFDAYKKRMNGTFEYPDMSVYFNQFNDSKSLKIVLSHFPENFSKVKELNYSQYDFDLMFSGHAHGGQFRIPLIGPIFSPGQGIFPKFTNGTHGKRPMLIISRGLGNSEFPFRLFNHPEIVVCDIK